MDNGILIAAGGLLSVASLISFMKGALGLGLVIFVHELGHFLVAKACGVKCEKFYVGFDPPLKLLGFQLPRTLFKKQWGETEYGIGIVPLGGYVKMLGQDDNPANAASEAERIRATGGQLDPRSYPAKTVPQRMAIISAGVVFNLIFGLIFATCAYKMGVKYTPTVIGSASAGDPAWLAGIKAGDRIVSVDADKVDDDQLRFGNDLKFKMFSIRPGDTVDMRLKDRDGKVRSISLQPDSGYAKRAGSPTIGVVMAAAPLVGAVIDGSIAQEAGLLPGDRITGVTVDGELASVDPEGDGFDLQKALARSQHKPITLSVQRETPKGATVDAEVKLGVDASERFGIELSMGPIVCVQKGSVADKAGLRAGDVMQTIDGLPVGDPLTLPIRMLDHIGKEIALVVERDGSSVDLQLTPEAPLETSAVRRRNGPIGLDTMGVGYVMHPRVSGVVPGSPAEEAGIQVGDVLKSAQLIIPEVPIPEDRRWPVFAGYQQYRERSQTRKLLAAYELDKPVLVDEENNNWPFVVTSVQDSMRLKFEVDLIYDRDGTENVVHLKPAKSTTTVDVSRGFILKGYEETRTATTWAEAFSLGRREVWEGMQQVLLVLRKLTSNYQNLGGPLTIVAAATMEASEGWSRLLIFLTMLSANLAVLNFLPIPVLDGGHMLFLAYEGIVGKPVDERVQMSLTLVGFGLLMGLMGLVLTLDFGRFFG